MTRERVSCVKVWPYKSNRDHREIISKVVSRFQFSDFPITHTPYVIRFITFILLTFLPLYSNEMNVKELLQHRLTNQYLLVNGGE